MTKEEKISAIKDLLSKYVAERIKGMADGAVLRAFDVEAGFGDFLQKWLDSYHGEDKTPHYVIKELIKYMESIHKPYNVPYVLEVTEDSWSGEAPDFTLAIPAHVHNLLGCIEVNAYVGTDSGYDLVDVGLSVDFDKNITVRSATRFSGKIEAFSSVGETPELQHRQPVYTVKGFAPNEEGDIEGITEAMFVSALAEKINNVLFKDNTEEYRPTGDYHPATKKYVDDRISEDGSVSLSDYYTKGEVDTTLENFYTKGEVDEALSGVTVDLSGYYTKGEVYTKEEVDAALSWNNF
jgi:hypothetical protein